MCYFLCPYCNCNCIIDNKSSEKAEGLLSIKDYQKEDKYFYIKHIVCPNPECRKPIIDIEIKRGFSNVKIYEKRLLPEYLIKKQLPSYIPQQIINDYLEACSIVELSPKASATLSRRCLQGMIHDFWNIKKSRLIDEISELKNNIPEDTWEAIDSLRKIGNIGAHMEKDVNVIVDVDPEEAAILISLIEMLFEEWYIARHNKEERMKKIKEIATVKEEARKGIPSVTTPSSPFPQD